MLVATVQRYKHLVNKSYKPAFLRSKFVSDSNYFESYKFMLNKLSEHTGKPFVFGVDSCYWVWVDNPFFEFYKGREEDYCVCFLDVPKASLVLTDYDKWVSSNNYGSTSLESCIVNEKAIGTGRCIQGVTQNIDIDSIFCICPISKALTAVPSNNMLSALLSCIDYDISRDVFAKRNGTESVNQKVFDSKGLANLCLSEFSCILWKKQKFQISSS